MSRKKALVIGINYEGTSSQLNDCVPDAENNKKLLDTYFPFEELRILTDKTAEKPTKANILSNLNWLLEGAKEGDILWFSYSGHGSNVRDTDGDEVDGRDETLVPLDYNQAGLITDDVLFREYLVKVPRGVKLYVLMDCCHSETILDLRNNVYKLRYRSGRSEETRYESLIRPNNRCPKTDATIVAISGCIDAKYSYEVQVDGKPTGALTYCLHYVVEQNKRSLNKLEVGYLFHKVNKVLKQKRLSVQKPQLSFGNDVDLNLKFLQ